MAAVRLISGMTGAAGAVGGAGGADSATGWAAGAGSGLEVAPDVVAGELADVLADVFADELADVFAVQGCPGFVPSGADAVSGLGVEPSATMRAVEPRRW